jgi:3-oxoacyl-[acyl-carrier-protein] synthase-3
VQQIAEELFDLARNPRVVVSMPRNLQRYGNTSAGSIPIVLDEAFQAGKIHRGDTLLLSGFGAGLTWGTALFRW